MTPAPRVPLFGGFQGMPPFRVGEVHAEYVVLGDPRTINFWAMRRAVEAQLNREKREHRLDRGLAWRLADLLEWPPALPDEAQRMEADVLDAFGHRKVGRVVLVWPSAEVMGSGL